MFVVVPVLLCLSPSFSLIRAASVFVLGYDRVHHCVRGSWFVVRGLWFVVCGLWLVFLSLFLVVTVIVLRNCDSKSTELRQSGSFCVMSVSLVPWSLSVFDTLCY